MPPTLVGGVVTYKISRICHLNICECLCFWAMLAASIQLSIQPCRKEENLRQALKMARSALARGAEILVFPELFITGFCYEKDLSEAAPYPSLYPFFALVQEHDCMVIGSIVDGRTNLGFSLDSEGIGFQPKIHPFGPEKEHFDGGTSILPIETKRGMVGLEICYDLRFPEVARNLALKDADFLVTIAQFPFLRKDHWKNLCIARAIENQIPHIACNGAGPEFCGKSMIVDSWGQVLAEADLEETIVFGEIDLAHRDSIRDSIPVFKDRRADVYCV